MHDAEHFRNLSYAVIIFFFLKFFCDFVKNENEILVTTLTQYNAPRPPSLPSPLSSCPSPHAHLIQDRGQGVRPKAKDCRKC